MLLLVILICIFTMLVSCHSIGPPSLSPADFFDHHHCHLHNLFLSPFCGIHHYFNCPFVVIGTRSTHQLCLIPVLVHENGLYRQEMCFPVSLYSTVKSPIQIFVSNFTIYRFAQAFLFDHHIFYLFDRPVCNARICSFKLIPNRIFLQARQNTFSSYLFIIMFWNCFLATGLLHIFPYNAFLCYKNRWLFSPMLFSFFAYDFNSSFLMSLFRRACFPSCLIVPFPARIWH